MISHTQMCLVQSRFLQWGELGALSPLLSITLIGVPLSLCQTSHIQNLSRWATRGCLRIRRITRAGQSDRGGEYFCSALKNRFHQCGTREQLGPAYLHHQNGVAQDMNHTLLVLVRSILQHENILKRLWAEASSLDTYAGTGVSSPSLPVNKMRHHLLKGSALGLAHLRVFGSKG